MINYTEYQNSLSESIKKAREDGVIWEMCVETSGGVLSTAPQWFLGRYVAPVYLPKKGEGDYVCELVYFHSISPDLKPTKNDIKHFKKTLIKEKNMAKERKLYRGLVKAWDSDEEPKNKDRNSYVIGFLLRISSHRLPYEISSDPDRKGEYFKHYRPLTKKELKCLYSIAPEDKIIDKEDGIFKENNMEHSPVYGRVKEVCIGGRSYLLDNFGDVISEAALKELEKAVKQQVNCRCKFEYNDISAQELEWQNISKESIKPVNGAVCDMKVPKKLPVREVECIDNKKQNRPEWLKVGAKLEVSESLESRFGEEAEIIDYLGDENWRIECTSRYGGKRCVVMTTEFLTDSLYVNPIEKEDKGIIQTTNNEVVRQKAYGVSQIAIHRASDLLYGEDHQLPGEEE